MDSRPNHIDLGTQTFDGARSGASTPRDLPSPRSGDVPPALSPLDAFALQGRILAQRLEAENTNGRRVSRLPPLTIANALAQSRPGFFVSHPPVSPKTDSRGSPVSAGPDALGNNPEVSQPKTRPRSFYPYISAFDDAESITSEDPAPTIRQVRELDHKNERPQNYGYIAPGRGRPFSPDLPVQIEYSEESPKQGIKKSWTGDSVHSNNSNGLAAPRSPAPHRPPRVILEHSNMRSVRVESGDDSDNASIHGPQRTSSYSSSLTRERSPFSPVFAPPRSPSVSSDFSLHHARGSVNFSRPISRAERPSFETRTSYDGSPYGLDSPPFRPSTDVLSLSDSIADSPRLRNALWADVGSPFNLTDDDASPRLGTATEGRTYVTTKYSLPRGRPLSKASMQPEFDAAYENIWGQSQGGLKQTISLVKDPDNRHDYGDRAEESGRLSTESAPPSEPVMTRTLSADDSIPPPKNMRVHKSNPSFPPPSISSTSTSSTRTVQPGFLPNLKPFQKEHMPSSRSPLARAPHSASANSTWARTPDPAVLAESLRQLTPEGHLAKGISCHEDGELLKSTYHLRLAARGGNATAMLLYALACRHGWGMRPNQAEGVSWLRKAVDHSGIEVAEDENETSHTSGADAMDPLAQKTHKAQLALAIYELGVSYMNGWGIAQDKALALRCFEIAGSWGDADAMAEAGFCYAKGVGCKKNLKRAADFYRRAEKKGVEMAGNSWIYKDKYMPPPPPPHPSEVDDRKSRGKDKDREKKPRDKSRTRTIFGGRRKQEQAAS